MSIVEAQEEFKNQRVRRKLKCSLIKKRLIFKSNVSDFLIELAQQGKDLCTCLMVSTSFSVLTNLIFLHTVGLLTADENCISLWLR